MFCTLNERQSTPKCIALYTEWKKEYFYSFKDAYPNSQTAYAYSLTHCTLSQKGSTPTIERFVP